MGASGTWFARSSEGRIERQLNTHTMSFPNGSIIDARPVRTLVCEVADLVPVCRRCPAPARRTVPLRGQSAEKSRSLLRPPNDVTQASRYALM